jgi:23S rRNA G2445 N2-methylase RlmL
MHIFTTPSRIIITCHKWLSPALQNEVTALGMNIVRAFPTGVELLGTVQDCIRLNLHLRCASQVMYSILSFKCDSPDALHKQLLEVPWEDILKHDGYFSVTSNVYHESIKTDLFANLRVKDAIVDRFREVSNIRPNTGSTLAGAVVHLYWKYEDAEVFIDTSGETLAKHGYRKLPGKAPMLEALAAAAILSTKWNRQSMFINPMCGSGTLAIEAALIATKRAPGLLRTNYAFMHLKGYNEAMYTAERNTLETQIQRFAAGTIVASDISQLAIDVARKNAEAAGVAHLIKFVVCDFEQTPVVQGSEGIVIFNPEYGERLGDIAALEGTYARMGDFLKKQCKGYTGYVFTGNLLLAKKIRLQPSRRIEFYNATIDCRLLEYEMYEGSRKAAH